VDGSWNSIEGAERNPAAVTLGRLDGKVKVPRGFAVPSGAKRTAKAKKGAQAREADLKKNPGK
jgi:hypothetical protein